MKPLALYTLLLAANCSFAAEDGTLFVQQVAPIFERHCVSCHNDNNRKGKLSLQSEGTARAGGENGELFVPKIPDASLLLDYIAGDEPEMPKDADPLSADEIAAIRKWIDEGAVWPKGLKLAITTTIDFNWWSLKPVQRPPIPAVQDTDRVRTPIDSFVLQKLHEKGMRMSPEADRRTLVRRLYFDLTGLPPSPSEVEQFVRDPDPLAYEKLVDRLLASPRYGERWARHWLDVVHYGETHGYDKDKPRMNAWPYRDYVIRSFNEDKPYERFVQEQIAGDALWPNTADGILGTGFIAAGPWDFIGHAEVPESKIDGKVARNLDRDNMVTNTMNTFCSLTIQCARCHNHKLDPVTMKDYYGLQAVFAAIDRADREYDLSPEYAQQREVLTSRKKQITSQLAALEKKTRELAGPELAKLDTRIAELNKTNEAAKKPRPEFGFHSHIEKKQDVAKWVQVDLGRSQKIEHVIIVGCNDDFNSIGEGFGFPVRFRIDASDDKAFNTGVTTIVDHTSANYKNPGVVPQSFPADGTTARYIRVTATKLVNRLPTDYIFALAELTALAPDKQNLASGKKVTSLDSIQAPVRWRRANLVDGYYYGVWNHADLDQLTKLGQQRQEILDRVLTDEIKSLQIELTKLLLDTEAALQRLPARGRVYVGCVHQGSGNFRGRSGLGPREIFVLHRGNVTQPGEPAAPATVPFINDVPAKFDLASSHDEGDRRIALADWIVRHDNPLTWRSIVNRIWHYHFGQGIVDTPNDFGRGGSQPTHPELLDWLAAEFRGSGGSIKDLHRLICISTVYRQSSVHNEKFAKIDGGNQLLWRMNRRRLTAEEIHDSVLAVADRLDTKMGGPSYMDFVIEHPAHSPHYEYRKYDPHDPNTHRRAVYRFIVRSQPQPFMNTLDCADPSMSVPKRDETLTALQALALLNNRFMVAMSVRLADRLESERTTTRDRIKLGWQLAGGSGPTPEELDAVVHYADEHGIKNAARLILNFNKFVFVD